MRCLLLISASLLLASRPGFCEGVAWDGGGAQGGNGRASEVRADARRVYRNFGVYLAQALAVDRDRAAMTPDEFIWLEKVHTTWVVHHRGVPRLLFGTADGSSGKLGSKTGPGYALWTGSRLGDDLWINLDYADGQTDAEIAATLISGLAIQLGLTGQDQIDQFQQDVMVTMESQAMPGLAGR